VEWGLLLQQHLPKNQKKGMDTAVMLTTWRLW
jgi:hypothetical protein